MDIQRVVAVIVREEQLKQIAEQNENLQETQPVEKEQDIQQDAQIYN